MNREEGYRKTRDAMREHYPRFSDGEYRRRNDLVRKMMDESGLDCLVIYGDSGNSCLNQLLGHYISNYMDEMYSYVVYPRKGEPTLYVSVPPDRSAAMACSVMEDVREGGMSIPMAGRVAKQLQDLKMDGKKVGIVDGVSIAPSLPQAHHSLFTEKLPRSRFVNVTAKYEEMKIIPSEEEMVWFRKGAELSDAGVDALIEAAEPGKTEAELWGAVHSAGMERGGSFGFCILGATPMSDPCMSYPHGISNLPATRKLRKGDFINAEISGNYYGYSGQVFAAISLGEPPKRYREMHDFALALYKDLRAAVKPGATEKDIFKIAQKVKDKGLDIEAPFIHTWGPFFGAPVVGMDSWTGPMRLRQGQLIMIEPNPCTPDTLMGLQIGHLTRVEAGGSVPIHRRGTELIVK